VVVEVPDIDAARARLKIDSPAPTTVSWGAKLFQLRDPDGIPVTFLEWIHPKGKRNEAHRHRNLGRNRSNLRHPITSGACWC
jgi:hypothetical protein